MIPTITAPQLSNTSWYLEGREVRGVIIMLTDGEVMFMYFAFALLCVCLFWLVSSMEQDFEQRCKECKKKTCEKCVKKE